MSEKTTNTPPERCPVCDMIYDWKDTDDKGQLERVTYNCGARWQVYTNGAQGWTDECPHAMTAALRCGATLHPTALETARDELVGSAINALTGHSITSLDIHNLRQLAYAYIAALEQRS